MKTKIFSLHRIIPIILMVLTSTFVMAANSDSRDVTDKAKTIILADYAIAMDAMEMMDNPNVLKNGAEVNLTDIPVEKIYVSIGADLRFKENVDTHKAVPNKTSCNRDLSILQDLSSGTKNQVVVNVKNHAVPIKDINANVSVILNTQTKADDIKANVLKNDDYKKVDTQGTLVLVNKNDWNQNVSSGNESQRSIELSSMATNSHLNYGILIAGGNNNNIVKTWNDYSSQHNCYLFI